MYILLNNFIFLTNQLNNNFVRVTWLNLNDMNYRFCLESYLESKGAWDSNWKPWTIFSINRIYFASVKAVFVFVYDSVVDVYPAHSNIIRIAQIDAKSLRSSLVFSYGLF